MGRMGVFEGKSGECERKDHASIEGIVETGNEEGREADEDGCEEGGWVISESWGTRWDAVDYPLGSRGLE